MPKPERVEMPDAAVEVKRYMDTHEQFGGLEGWLRDFQVRTIRAAADKTAHHSLTEGCSLCRMYFNRLADSIERGRGV